MCGISGISVSNSKLINTLKLDESVKSLNHRGPDDAGSFVDIESRIALLHTRLSILDLSHSGHQPMVSDDGKMVIVFNGEIYNYHELRSELMSRGYEFKGNSDTEVLLRLLEDQNRINNDLSLVLQKLNGIFAFAFWNSNNSELFIARDHFGIKPLYYTVDKELFAFASEIKAILPLSLGSRELDMISIHRYLTFLWCPGEGTPLKGVKKLGPGEFLRVKEGLIIEHKKWYKKIFYNSNRIASYFEKLSCSKENMIRATAKHLKSAVQRQMVSDVPVGAFLSGGLDSSSIVAFAKEINPNIHCFTIQASNGDLDEATDDIPYAVKVAKHLKVPLEIVSINSEKMAKDFAEMVVHLDEPLADPACLNVLYISQMAKQMGIKVLLSGAGGDDIFTGYRRHHALMLEKWWTWLPNSTKKGLQNVTGLLNNNTAFKRRLKKMFRSASLDDEARLIDYFIWAGRDDLYALYSPDFKDAIRHAEADAPIREFLNDIPEDTVPLEKMLALEQRFFLTDHNLLYTDKMSMAAGVEVRVPFLDRDLVEYIAQIPLQFKQRGSCGKWILKKAMEPYLPHDVIYRPKSGFGAPLRRWIRFEFKELIGDILSSQSLRNRGIFEPDGVHRLIAANSTGKIDASYTILSLLLIELWCRHFIDSQKMRIIQ
jgi:asparagine synthase (glutamine-hydrolysing)